MADLTITAANVISAAGATRTNGIAGVALTAGQQLFRDPADSKWKLADNNAAAAATRAVKGVALNNAALNQPIAVHLDGDITIGATLAPGVAYYLSDTPGGICPVADLASGEYPTLLGIAKSTTVLDYRVQAAGVALA